MAGSLTIFCGATGSGKTANMVAEFVTHMIDKQRYYAGFNCAKNLISQGFNYKLPPQQHFCYSTVDVIANVSGGAFMKNYALNPHKIALPNNEIPYQLFFPYSVVAIDETQLVWPSSDDRKISEYKYGFVQNRRHFDIDMLLDVQFVTTLARQIRIHASKYVRCIKIEQKYDKFSGKAIQTIFHNLEFATDEAVEDFEKNKSLDFETNKKYSCANYVVKKYDFDVFSCYNSKGNFYYFLPKQDETVEVHFIEDAPEGFFDKPNIKKVG